ncbi:iron complex transport system permease protein [Jiangella sp. DSM 45060]|nr:iron chelate uptake ABC transporter family permease subunit [Jiangella sp. DSM 45060]SDT46040.1 iron complex transport system permease protein [Jiangella sp. DSM 45060]
MSAVASPVVARARRSGVIVALTVVLLTSMVAALALGAVTMPVGSVLEVVGRRLGLADVDVTLLDDQIVWQLRLPRVLGAAATGAGLAMVGAVLQSLTRNDLADPYLLGISGGASVGAVMVIVLGVSVAGVTGSAMLTAGAFAGALAALFVVLLLASDRTGALPPARTILAGVAVGQICAAYTAFVVIMNGDGDAARRVLSWTLGSLAGVRWGSAIFLVAVTLVAAVVIMAFASDLDAFAFGESAAGSLGVNVHRLRWLLMVVTALLTACLVSYTGAIGFVGLVVPHIARMLIGVRHHRLLPASALGGATLLVWADTAARSLVSSQEIPVGVVTAAVGAPVFAVLLRRARRRA